MAHLFFSMILLRVYRKYVIAYQHITSSALGITVLKNSLSESGVRLFLDEQCKLQNDCRNLMLRLFPHTYPSNQEDWNGPEEAEGARQRGKNLNSLTRKP